MRLFWSRGSSSSEGWNGQYELEGRLSPRHPEYWAIAGASPGLEGTAEGSVSQGTRSLPLCS